MRHTKFLEALVSARPENWYRTRGREASDSDRNCNWLRLGGSCHSGCTHDARLHLESWLCAAVIPLLGTRLNLFGRRTLSHPKVSYQRSDSQSKGKGLFIWHPGKGEGHISLPGGLRKTH